MDPILLTCPVCLDLATTPRETNCCSQVFCFECIQPLTTCPICRADHFTHRENKVVARMLNALPATCPFECKEAVTRGNLEVHAKICEQRLFDCLAPTCGCVGLKGKDQFFGHMVSQHADDVDSALQLFYAKKRQSDTAINNVEAEIVQRTSSQSRNLVASRSRVASMAPLNGTRPTRANVVQRLSSQPQNLAPLQSRVSLAVVNSAEADIVQRTSFQSRNLVASQSQIASMAPLNGTGPTRTDFFQHPLSQSQNPAALRRLASLNGTGTRADFFQHPSSQSQNPAALRRLASLNGTGPTRADFFQHPSSQSQNPAALQSLASLNGTRPEIVQRASPQSHTLATSSFFVRFVTELLSPAVDITQPYTGKWVGYHQFNSDIFERGMHMNLVFTSATRSEQPLLMRFRGSVKFDFSDYTVENGLLNVDGSMTFSYEVFNYKGNINDGIMEGTTGLNGSETGRFWLRKATE